MRGTGATDVGPVGVWSFQFRSIDQGLAAEVAAEVEEAGHGAIWLPIGMDATIFATASTLLAATTRLRVGTGIVSIWEVDAATAAVEHAKVTAAHPGRFLLGLGVSHGPMVDAGAPGRYRRPLAKMAGYLDELAVVPAPPPRDEVALAALGPRMLALSAARTAGALPYFVPVEHTVVAREALGPEPLLAVEQAVMFETDPAAARDLARRYMEIYLGLPNYTKNLRRLGYGDDDMARGGSDRLVDAIVAWGDLDSVCRRVRDHLDAGADHVCIQVVTERWQDLPRAEWRALGEALSPEGARSAPGRPRNV